MGDRWCTRGLDTLSRGLASGESVSLLFFGGRRVFFSYIYSVSANHFDTLHVDSVFRLSTTPSLPENTWSCTCLRWVLIIWELRLMGTHLYNFYHARDTRGT